ncbi:unnamed protein product [Prunus armeniaca]|uniref:Uncharacterized protein n=1 Tax=Prunus armeniaca TaxID=36596 RepID=A0A6J5TTI6_PRUAR|nr:unnamed protein product [Prunus armeniaca]
MFHRGLLMWKSASQFYELSCGRAPASFMNYHVEECRSDLWVCDKLLMWKSAEAVPLVDALE